MNPTFVLDCSVAISWCFGDESTTASVALQNRLLDEVAVVPMHWPLEIANVLLMAEKHGRIAAPDVDLCRAQLEKFDVWIDKETAGLALTASFELARKYKVTSYDAAYLELASRYDLPLATWDKSLARAAKEMGIECIGR